MSNDRRLDFLCVGPQRTASSWLHRYLLPHPQLLFPKGVKETMFFDQYFEKGWPWYWAHFNKPDGGQKMGEVGPTYFDDDQALGRLRRWEGMKVIINVRDPVERTYSLFRHHRSRGRVPDDYHRAVRQMPRIETSGRYSLYCPRWEQAFGENRCFYLVQEDIEASPQATIDKVCDFLGVDRLQLPAEATKRFGQAEKPPSKILARAGSQVARVLRAGRMHGVVELSKRFGLRRLILGKPMGDEAIPDDVLRRLVELHRDDVEYLQLRLGREFSHWTACYSECKSES